jgi:hypothetical protein
MLMQNTTKAMAIAAQSHQTVHRHATGITEKLPLETSKLLHLL